MNAMEQFDKAVDAVLDAAKKIVEEAIPVPQVEDTTDDEDNDEIEYDEEEVSEDGIDTEEESDE